jgi:hypothetical protein
MFDDRYWRWRWWRLVGLPPHGWCIKIRLLPSAWRCLQEKNYNWHYCDGLRLWMGSRVRARDGLDVLAASVSVSIRGPDCRAWCSECSQVTPDTNYISRRVAACGSAQIYHVRFACTFRNTRPNLTKSLGQVYAVGDFLIA